MEHLHRLSIIIPTYRRSHMLKKTLAALMRQSVKPYQVIVVNNCVDISTDDVIKTYTTQLPVQYYHELRKGPSYARNTGYQHAKGDIVAFLDDDCVPDRNWCFEILHTYKKKLYKHVVFQENCTHVFPNTNFMVEMFYFRRNQIHKHPALFDGYRMTEGVHAGCCYMHKNVLQTLHTVFDAELFPFIGEELDFSVRVQLSGMLLVKNPNVRVTHLKQAHHSMLRSFKNSIVYGRALGIVHEKYYVVSSAARLFARESSEMQKKQLPLFTRNLSTFISQYRDKSFFWKLSAQMYELVRSLMIIIGYTYGKIWYRFFFRRSL